MVGRWNALVPFPWKVHAVDPVPDLGVALGSAIAEFVRKLAVGGRPVRHQLGNLIAGSQD